MSNVKKNDDKFNENKVSHDISSIKMEQSIGSEKWCIKFLSRIKP